MFDNTQHYALDVILVGGVIAADMRHRVTLTILLLMASLSLPCGAQITYWISGFHRQGNAEDARQYLEIGFINSNGWWIATNIVKYTNSTDLAGLVNADFGIGTNTTDKMPTNFYNNLNTALLPGVISGSSIGTNLTTILPSGIVTNRFTPILSLSNSLIINGPGGNPYILFQGNTGPSIQLDRGFGPSGVFAFYGLYIDCYRDFEPQTDAALDLGAAAKQWQDFFLYRNAYVGNLIIHSNGWPNRYNMTMVPGDNAYVSSNGIPHVIVEDPAGNFTTNRLIP